MKTLTPVLEFSDPKSPINGDTNDASFDEECFQASANRTHFLHERRKEAPASSVADAYGVIETVAGDANWHDSAVVTRALASLFVGEVVSVFCKLSALPTNEAAQSVDFRVKVVDNGVTSYLDGAAQRIEANGTTHQVFLVGKHTMAGTSAVITLQIKNSNDVVSTALASGWSIMTL